MISRRDGFSQVGQSRSVKEDTDSSRDQKGATFVGLKERFAYAAGDTASVLYFHTFSQFLFIYYTDEFGIEPALVGWMFLIVRLFDVVTDPLMGMVADRTQSRYGKFRPWLRWGLIPYVALGPLIFFVPELSEGGRLIYAYLSYIAVMAVYSMVNIPYGALMGVMTPNPKERSVLASFRFAGAYTAVLFVNLTLLNLVSLFGGGDNAVGYFRTMALYAVIAGGLLYFTFAKTRERIEPLSNDESSVGRDLKLLFRTGPWLAICGIGIVTLIGITIRSTSVLYFLKYYIGANNNVITLFLTTGTVATLLGTVSTKGFEELFGSKRGAYIGLSVVAGMVSSGFYFVAENGIALLFTINLISAYLMGPLMPLFWSMIADAADYAEWKHRRRFTGLIFSAGTTSQKFGWAIGGYITGYILSWCGYVKNIEQVPETVEGIKLLMSYIPSGVGLASALAAMLYRITPSFLAQIQTELELRKKEAI